VVVWQVAVVAFETGLASSVMTPLTLLPNAASSWLLFLAYPSSVNTAYYFILGHISDGAGRLFCTPCCVVE